jgi:hypothetical protein
MPVRAAVAVLSILKKRMLHTIVNHGQPVLSGDGTLPKVIGLRLELTRPLLSSPQLKRKLVCEVHGARAIGLGSFSGFLKKRQDAIPNLICSKAKILLSALRSGETLRCVDLQPRNNSIFACRLSLAVAFVSSMTRNRRHRYATYSISIEDL